MSKFDEVKSNRERRDLIRGFQDCFMCAERVCALISSTITTARTTPGASGGGRLPG